MEEDDLTELIHECLDDDATIAEAIPLGKRELSVSYKDGSEFRVTVIKTRAAGEDS